MKQQLMSLAENLYRKEIVRRIFKDSFLGQIGPKLYYDSFLKNAEFPKYINIELTNVCNFDCIMCPNAIIDPKGHMDVALFKRIFNEIDKRGPATLMFVKQGEPLLHPNIKDIMKIIKNRKSAHKIMWVSNGSTLRKKNIDLLIDAQIGEVNISIDSLKPELYQKIRGFELSKILANIDLLQKCKKEKGSHLPKISINMVKMKETVGELASMRSYFKERGIEFTHQKFNSAFTSEEESKVLGDAKSALVPNRQTKRYPCTQVFTNTAINFDGTISLCCADWNYAYKVGDVRENSIEKIWNSERYQSVRKSHLNGRYDCKDCTAWQSNPNVFFPWQYKKASVAPAAPAVPSSSQAGAV
jgi:radical SAM protein with 4Fe4S-binding SPASM domain